MLEAADAELAAAVVDAAAEDSTAELDAAADVADAAADVAESVTVDTPWNQGQRSSGGIGTPRTLAMTAADPDAAAVAAALVAAADASLTTAVDWKVTTQSLTSVKAGVPSAFVVGVSVIVHVSVIVPSGLREDQYTNALCAKPRTYSKS